jgi:RNA polymerase sigma-70 factor (ECF subfamily)
VSDDASPAALADTLVGEAAPLADKADALRAAFDALAAGDLEALGAVYDLVADDLFGLALWRTGSREDAADAVQEVFIRLARSGRAVAGARRPRAYLLAMAHRAAVDIVRRRRRSEPLEDTLLEPVAPNHEAQADAARISALVRTLPAAQREAVYLRHFSGLTFAEIGVATRVPTFTAASRCRLGLARVRKLLGVTR